MFLSAGLSGWEIKRFVTINKNQKYFFLSIKFTC